MKKMLLLLVLGAAVAYLFDPDSGIRRRAGLRRKVESFGRQTPEPPAGPLSQVA
jgi:hypothetical protein